MRHTLLAFCAVVAFVLAIAVPSLAQSAPPSVAPSPSSSVVITSQGSRNNDDSSQYEVLIPLVGEVGFYFAIVGGLLATLIFRFKSDQQRLETLRDLVNKGRDVPAALFARNRSKPTSDLKKSLILIATGLGVSGALLMTHEPSVAGFGLIPTLIGLAYYIVWRVERGAPSSVGDE